MEKFECKVTNRKSISANLKSIDCLANDNDSIEVTEWTNGEGYDINILSDNDNKYITLSFGELDAINFLIKKLEYEN